ncbi:MAG: transcriptional regulator [Betaproteobacteria bacterium]|jgi:LysR family glycine cleavage system transcriptional activator|nr:transcriptional regulator [Betaproteobacteria bacterium]
MRRRLPSLNALKAFEATARHESFTKAAQELFVTQGAVSQQVKALEADLGLRLFRRERQRLIITEAGRAYLEVVRDAFDRLGAGTERLLQRQKSGVLTITTSPDFAAKWLVHRLGRFSEAHPEIDLRVSASIQHVDFAREDFDLAIRHGTGQWPGLHVTRLCTEKLFPVCSPQLLKGPGALRSPRDIKRHRLLYTNSADGWARWLAHVGVDGVDFTRGTLFNQSSMAMDAAIDGQGIALARTALASWDLICGRLARPFADALEAPYAYFIVCPQSAADLPKISTFRNWLLREAEDDALRIAELNSGMRAGAAMRTTRP